MKLRSSSSIPSVSWVLCVLSLAWTHAHAEPPPAPVPAQPLAKKGALIISDDFERTELAPWKQNCQTFTVGDGVMKGSQTRTEHGAVGAVHAAFKDAVIEFKFRFEGATGINAVCDDKAYTGSHAGHICRVTLTPKLIRLGDDREGGMRNDIMEMRKDPQRKAEGDKLLVGRTQAFPTPIEPHRWYRLTMEIVGDEMRVSLDDKPVGYLKSPGIAHATKSDFHFTVSGKDALFDDVRIWSAAPAASN
jgi:hypothetical protein